ncbi:MAG TPA: efflux RND transporter periplasmic adaptor subunit [Bryobacteraceae bacterium]|nr:efflux RND transporter periplasmic adaptor subunit [Bryobacteraceae bacterium]
MPTINEQELPTGSERRLARPDGLRPGVPPPTPRRGRAIWLVLALLIILAALFFYGYQRHVQIEQVAQAEAKKEQDTLPVVTVAKVRKAEPASELLLPGNMIALTEAYVYARSSGYVKKRLVDIGDRVKAGQLLAEIESPDLDQQVDQARASVAQAEKQLEQTRANLANAQAQLELARVTWDRYKVLAEHGAIARQDADQQFATFRSAEAAVNSAQANISAADQNVKANQANLQRMITLQAFEKVTAPFAGVITARNFDVGALIGGSGGSLGSSPTPLGGTQNTGQVGNAGTSGSAALVSGGNGVNGGGELYRMAQVDTLRILINVPQQYAPDIRVGQVANVTIREFAGHPFEGHVTRTSNAIDANTRTLLTEVQVPNREHRLLPGMYAEVKLISDRVNPPVMIPGEAILTGASGLQVAMLEDVTEPGYPPNARRIHMQNVEVGRDYGPELEIINGLQGWEHVVVSPSDAVEEGAIVNPSSARPTPPRNRPAAKSGGQH